MHQENRRSFVKKSLATSMTFTFSGLIRAHGEEGGETTTSSPEETTIVTTFETTIETTPSNPEDTTIETTDSGGTTTWNPEDSTVETSAPPPTTASNPEETTEATTVGTTTPKEPSIRKQDPVGCDANGKCPVSMKSTGFGTLVVRENKGGSPPVFEDRFQAKVYWVVESTLEIPKAGYQSTHIVPVKKECFQCTAKSIKAYFKVEKTSGTAASLATAIENALNEQLRIAYNSSSTSDKFVPAPDLVNGVSGEAIEPQPDYAEIKTSYGGPRETPQGQQLRMKLDATVNPTQDSSVKTITWTFTLLSGPQLTAGIKSAMQGAMETAVTSHDGSWQLTSWDLPDCTNLSPAPTPSQQGTAQKLYQVQPGATCNLP